MQNRSTLIITCLAAIAFITTDSPVANEINIKSDENNTRNSKIDSSIIQSTRKIDLKSAIKINMNNINGALVILDLQSNDVVVYDSSVALSRNTPCSSFKIWNTLFGIENGIIKSENDQFYKWDGEKRFLPEWNKDLSLQEAFQFSCVPAYQNLAKKIGVESMQNWIDKINYGDKDISSGIDQFWLPRKGKKSIKISPEEQAILMKKLINNQLGFSDKSIQILKKVMHYKTTDKGSLYGKTGSGQDVDDVQDNNIGWYVGYIIGNNGKYAFSCLLRGKNASGKSARDLVNQILIDSNLL